jgi:tetratricopeptide (TPR) repeat protein
MTDDIARKAEIDRLISFGNVYRMRGEYVAAEDSYRQAFALDETRDDLRELIADMLYARAKLDDAAGEYKALVEKNAGNVTAETKYARTVLEIGEREYSKQMMKATLENPGAFTVRPKKPAISMALSACAPGFGQIYNGEVTKGGIILAVFFLSVLFLSALRTDFGNLLKLLGTLTAPQSTLPPISPLAILFASISVFVWIYSVIDAPISADKMRAKKDGS